jgi:gamma-tubulin complex component 3
MESTVEEIVKSLVPDLSYDEQVWASKWVKGPLSVHSSGSQIPLQLVAGKLISQNSSLGSSDLVELGQLISRLDRVNPHASDILQIILKSVSSKPRELESFTGPPTVVTAELLPSTEPLLSGVSTPQRSDLEERMFGVSERSLVQDSVYVIQGIDGKYLKLSGDVDLDMEPFASTLVAAIISMGWTYKSVVDTLKTVSSPSLLFLTFKTAIVRHLRDYLAIAGLVDSNIGQWTLLKLVTWLDIPFRKLRFLQSISDRVCEKPEQVLSILREIHHGTYIFRSISKSLFDQVVTVWLQLVGQWTARGKLPLNGSDFFVRQRIINDLRPAKLVTDKIDLAELWNDTFELVDVPALVDKSTAATVLEAGKSAAFIRACGRSIKVEEEGLFTQLWDLKSDVAVVAEALHKQVLELLLTQGQLVDRLNDLKRFMLFGQGDFADCIESLARKELIKPATAQNKFELQFLIDCAVRRSVVNVREIEPLLSRLTVFLDIPSSTADTGFEIFSLDYSVEPPVEVVLTQDVMKQYRKLSVFLFQLLRSDAAIRNVWIGLQTLGRKTNSILILDNVCDVIERANIVRSEISWFLHVFRSLICYEVLEGRWREFSASISASKSLDEIISVQSGFLQKLESELFLNPSDDEVLSQLQSIFGVSTRFSLAFPSMQAELATAVATGEDISEFRLNNMSALLEDFHDLYNDAYNMFMDLLKDRIEQQEDPECFELVSERLMWYSE